MKVQLDMNKLWASLAGIPHEERKVCVMSALNHIKNGSQDYKYDVQVASIVECFEIPKARQSIILPFSEEFRPVWEKWIDYRKQIKKNYKTAATEQAAAHHLHKISSGNAHLAADIIDNSIGNGYQGLIPPKNNIQYGQKQPTGANVSTGSAFSKIDRLPS